MTPRRLIPIRFEGARSGGAPRLAWLARPGHFKSRPERRGEGKISGPSLRVSVASLRFPAPTMSLPATTRPTIFLEP